MTTVNSVNNTTPALTSSGAAPKRPVPPSVEIAGQTIAAAKKTTEAGSAPVISRRISPLTSTSSGTESSSTSTTTSSTSTSKVPAKKSIVAELEENVEKLSPFAQDLFVDALSRYRSNVAALRETFNSTNGQYVRHEKMLDQGETRQRLKKLKKEEEDRYSNMRYNKGLLDRRVLFLHKTIMKLFIEFGLLQHSIIGNDSRLPWPDRYGADYRLREMGTPDNTDEKTSIVVKDDSKESSSTASSTTVTSVEQTQSSQDSLTRMLHDMVSLKERVTICFEALKLTMYSSFNITRGGILDNLSFQQQIRDDIAASDFPKIYYLIYSKQFEDLNKRIKSALGLNKTPPEIADKQGKLANILSQMQAHFKLVIKKEEAQAPASVEEVLSDVCSQAFDLIKQITTLKTDVLRLSNSNPLLGTSWDNRIPLLNRGTALKREVADFKTRDMAQRLEAINKEVGIYKAYMDIIKENMDAIDGHFKALEAASLLRTTWKLDPPAEVSKEVTSTSTVPQAVTSSSSTSSSSSWFSSLLSWGTTSSAPATTSAATTTSTTTVLPGEASTVATTTISTTIPDPVIITVPSTASTVITTTTSSTTTIPAASSTTT